MQLDDDEALDMIEESITEISFLELELTTLHVMK